MNSRKTFLSIVLLVVALHFCVIVAIFFGKESELVQEVSTPAIEGVIIAPPTPELTSAPAPSPQENKPQEKKSIVEKVLSTSKKDTTNQTMSKPEEKAAVSEAKQSTSVPTETVADDVVLPHTDASHINNPAPTYPALSRRNKEEGTVILTIVVLADGTVSQVRVKTSSGYSRLDQSAINTVKNWHFVPAKKGAESIDYEYDLPIEFSLK